MFSFALENVFIFYSSNSLFLFTKSKRFSQDTFSITPSLGLSAEMNDLSAEMNTQMSEYSSQGRWWSSTVLQYLHGWSNTGQGKQNANI